jgi:hypothetical protein
MKWRIWGIIHAAFSSGPTEDFGTLVGAYDFSVKPFISFYQISNFAWVSAIVRSIELGSQPNTTFISSCFPSPCSFSSERRVSLVRD